MEVAVVQRMPSVQRLANNGRSACICTKSITPLSFQPIFILFSFIFMKVGSVGVNRRISTRDLLAWEPNTSTGVKQQVQVLLC